MINSHSLNQMAFGEALAGSRGVNTKKLFLTTLGAGVILTTSAVAVAGPIGFVGLVIPHGVRILSGNDQRITAFLGAPIFMILLIKRLNK